MKDGTLQKMATVANRLKASLNENNIRASEVIADKKKAGMGYSAIAKVLNEKKFQTSRGNQFTGAQVRRMWEGQIAA